ncbi:MAG: hypothetical protein KC621_30660, partial [Myxococcales bacterium]|nr:hypothetical protein [Myxococcales bacterium]
VTVRWTASTTGEFLVLSAGDDTTNVTCSATDDGEFRVPAADAALAGGGAWSVLRGVTFDRHLPDLYLGGELVIIETAR